MSTHKARKILDEVRDVMRLHHYSIHTAEALRPLHPPKNVRDSFPSHGPSPSKVHPGGWPDCLLPVQTLLEIILQRVPATVYCPYCSCAAQKTWRTQVNMD